MYAVMLPGQRAAMMIANYISGGSIPKFVEMMNTRAKELGARNTNFTSPHGLPDSAAYTTAYDMYLIASHAMTLDGFSELLEKTSMDGGPTNLQQTLLWVSTNKLIRQNTDYYNASVTGIKNGYDGDNGSCMVSMAKRDGYSYMLVVMGCKAKDAAAQNADYNEAFAETNRLYDWAFDTYRVKTLLEKGKSFGELKLELTWGKDFIRLMSADNFTALLPKDVESSSIRFELDVPESVRAPVAKGDLIGSVRLILMDEEIGRVNVVSAETVEVSRALLLLDKVLNITKTFWFKFIVLFLILLILFYSVLTISKNRSRRRYSNRKKTRQ
jgi:D-alanyl-D-alanine carboxypeptidase